MIRGGAQNYFAPGGPTSCMPAPAIQRRGWADEALQQGGPTALFYSGGWRGVAAFGYTSAKSRGAVAAAEWCIDFSDSSGED